MHVHFRGFGVFLVIILLITVVIVPATAFIAVNRSSNVTVAGTTPVVTVYAAPIKPALTRYIVPQETITFTKTTVPVNPSPTTPGANPFGNNVAGIPQTTLAVVTNGVTQPAGAIIPTTPLPVAETTPAPAVTSVAVPARSVSTVPSATQTPVPTFQPTQEPTTAPPLPESPLPTIPSKNLPLSGIIPDEAAPAASVGLGIALTFAAAAFSAPVSGFFSQLIGFFQGTLGDMVSGEFANRVRDSRQIIKGDPEKLCFGFSQKEFIVLAAGALIVGGLFLFADRLPFDPVMVTIYVIMGGIALVLHEVAHWYYQKKFGVRTEIQFWGTGTIIMVLTAWLFGNVFAQPFLTVLQSPAPVEKRSVGLIMLSGPFLSVLIACACLALVPLGGLFSVAGWTGFIMNLMMGVYELLPVTPCDGKEVFGWNRLVWVLVFIPLFGMYLVAIR